MEENTVKTNENVIAEMVKSNKGKIEAVGFTVLGAAAFGAACYFGDKGIKKLKEVIASKKAAKAEPAVDEEVEK